MIFEMNNKNKISNKILWKRAITMLLSGAVFATAQTGSIQFVQAAEIRTTETAEMLEQAKENMTAGTYVQGEAIVTLEASEAAALVQEGNYRYDKCVEIANVSEFGESPDGRKNRYIVRLTSDEYSTEELMQLALKQYQVDGVSPNGYYQLMENTAYNDPYQTSQWYLDGGTDPYDMVSKGIQLSAQKITLRETPVIAVLDTGVNYKHPDLVDHMWINPYPEKLKGTYGYDFGNDDDDPMDTYGHGTHVAGIAAAEQNNGIGIVGVADAQIMALKIADDENVSISQWSIIEAYEYVEEALRAGVNIKAINCSWGGNSDTNGVLSKAVTAVGELGALSVFAAGNDGTNWDMMPASKLVTPYDLDSPYVVIVGATNEQDEAAYYSDYGAKKVDLFAPGSNILSTYMEDYYLPKIYDSSVQSRLTSYYNKCSNETENIIPEGQTYQDVYSAAQLGIPTDYSVKSEIVRDGAEGYIRMEIIRNRPSYYYSEAQKEEAGSVYVDVTNLQLDPSATYYVGYMNGGGENGELCWQNGQKISKPGSSRFVYKDGRTYFRIIGLQIQPAYIGQKFIFYLDDFAISVANPDTSRFGQYSYLEGTSMAAPMVSGVLATIAGANPDMDAATLRRTLISSVRKVSALADKCITGGIIDCSTLVVRASAIKLNKTSATVKYGKTLTLKAKVSPTNTSNTKVTWKSSNTKYATVNSKGVVKVKKAGIGHTVKIAATTADGTKLKAVCKIKIKK